MAFHGFSGPFQILKPDHKMLNGQVLRVVHDMVSLHPDLKGAAQ